MTQVGLTASNLGLPPDAPLPALLDAARGAGIRALMLADLPRLVLPGLPAPSRPADMALAGGIGAFNPLRPGSNPALSALGGGDVTEGLRRLIPLARGLGLTDLFFVIGMIEDREAGDWPDQRAAVAAAIASLGGALRASGLRLLVKTHEEITSREILSLIDEVGSDLLGVSLDPVNMVCRMEDPLAATRRLAPHVAQIHVDDAIVVPEDGTLRRWLVTMGTGDIDWPGILALLPDCPLWLEMHRGQFAWPAFDPAWLAREDGLALDDFAAVAGMALRRGPDAPYPDQDRPLERIPAALDWLTRFHSSQGAA